MNELFIVIAVILTLIAIILSTIIMTAYRRSPGTRHASGVTIITWSICGIVCLGLLGLAVVPRPHLIEDTAISNLKLTYRLQNIALTGGSYSASAASGDRPTDSSPMFTGYFYDEDMTVRFRASFSSNGTPHIAIISPSGGIDEKDLLVQH